MRTAESNVSDRFSKCIPSPRPTEAGRRGRGLTRGGWFGWLAVAAMLWPTLGLAEPGEVGHRPEQWFELPAIDLNLEEIRDELLASVGRTDPEVHEFWPFGGSLIVAVLEDYQAVGLGIRRGDIVVQVAGRAIGSQQDLSAVLKSPAVQQPYTMRLVRPGQEAYECRVQPGRIGIRHVQNSRRLMARYVREGRRDAAWDPWMLAALEADFLGKSAWVPPLLSAAIDAGYPADALSDALLFNTLMIQGRWAEAGDMLSPRLMVDGERHVGVTAENAYIALRAAGRWQDMAQLSVTHAQDIPDVDRAEREAWAQRVAPLADAEDLPPPATLAQNAPQQQRVNDRLTSEGSTFFGHPQGYMAQAMAGNGRFTVHQIQGHYLCAMLKLPDSVLDCEVVAEFTLEPAGAPHFDWPNALSIHLVNLAEVPDGSEDTHPYWIGKGITLGVTLTNGDPSEQEASLSITPHADSLRESTGYSAPWLAYDGKSVNQIRLTRFGSFGQIQINGQTVLHMPLDPRVEELGILVHVVGMTVQFSRFDINAFNFLDLPPGAI